MMTRSSDNESYIFDTASVTHQGLVRKFNEDSIFTNTKAGVWVVADGMGGHKDGNVASSMIAAAAQELSAQTSMTAHVSQFQQQLQSVNRKLLSLSNGDSNAIIGSTVVALLIHDNNYSCIWAGDSRCYLIRSGALSQISHDHTEVQELVDTGMITKDEARTWPRRNVVTRAVGAHQDFQLETVSGSLKAGDCFVLCSDGLTGHLEDQEILDKVSWSSGQEACDSLLSLALERGGKDNISIIIINIEPREATAVVHRW